MATPQLSPGVLVREVDLTVGRADNVLDNIGAIAGPFALGPVDDPIDITTEEDLINTFGKPLSGVWLHALDLCTQYLFCRPPDRRFLPRDLRCLITPSTGGLD